MIGIPETGKIRPFEEGPRITEWLKIKGIPDAKTAEPMKAFVRATGQNTIMPLPITLRAPRARISSQDSLGQSSSM
jgi:hypothetical protein